MSLSFGISCCGENYAHISTDVVAQIVLIVQAEFALRVFSKLHRPHLTICKVLDQN